MKKSMLNVITLTLVLINLILTGLLTFSLVSTSQKTNNLITKVASIIDLDIAGGVSDANGNGPTTVGIENLETIDIVNGDERKLTISVTGSDGKTHYAVVNVVMSLNKTSKDYEKKKENINNGMKLIVSEVYNTVSSYPHDQVVANKANIEQTLLTKMQDMFQTDMIYKVSITQVLVQ